MIVPIFYQNQINTYTITRFTKNPALINNIWDQIKIDIGLYFIKCKSKKNKLIISNTNKIIGIESVELNLKINFYTCYLSEDSSDNNILMLQNSNNKEETYITSIYNIPIDFYDNIKINNSLLNIPLVA